MKGNIYGYIIAGLIGAFIYQGGYLDDLFGAKTIKCDSEQAINLSKKIIKSKLFPKYFNNLKYHIDDIDIDTIFTKKINKDTGYRECQATSNIIGSFDINKNTLLEQYKYFSLTLGSDNVVNLGNNKYIISSSIWYTTEVASDRDQYLVNLKFDGDRAKALYSIKINQDDEKTFKLLLKQAKKGNAAIQNQIGVMYNNGQGVPQDFNQAKEWYEKAANQNYDWGLYNLADYYYSGTVVKQNYKKAFELFQKSANLGNYDAQNRLANMYYSGDGIKKDYLQAKYWYEKSANQNYDWALYNLGNMYYFGKGVNKDYKTAFKYISDAAYLGNEVAQNKLGIMYDNGMYVEKNYKEAFKWYQKSANNGYNWGQYNLAIMYYNGKFVQKNYKKAFELYMLSAKQENADAQNRLANMYYGGYGVKQDYLQAKEWYEKSANNGFDWAQYNLADMYYTGEKISIDYKKAFIWYEKSAKQNNREAQNMLAIMYRDGKGTKENYVKALHYFERSAENNFNAAFLQLGYMYRSGLGVEKNNIKAFEYFVKASDLNNYKAKCELAKIYLDGIGIAKNIMKAKNILKIPYKDNYKEAKEIWNNYKLDDKLSQIIYTLGISEIKIKSKGNYVKYKDQALRQYINLKKDKSKFDKIIKLKVSSLKYSSEINHKIFFAEKNEVLRPMKYNNKYLIIKVF